MYDVIRKYDCVLITKKMYDADFQLGRVREVRKEEYVFPREARFKYFYVVETEWDTLTVTESDLIKATKLVQYLFKV